MSFKQNRSIIVEGKQCIWLSERPMPKNTFTAGHLKAVDDIVRLIANGAHLRWQGDYKHAQELLVQIAQRFDKGEPKAPPTLPAAFQHYRVRQAQRASFLNRVLIPVAAHYIIALPRAPNVTDACQWALGDVTSPAYMSLCDLESILSAHENYKKGIPVNCLEDRIFPHFAVFSPARSEYLDLVARAKLPNLLQKDNIAFNIGVGTGVVAAILAKRGVLRVIATDISNRAIKCARENIERLNLTEQIECVETHLFPKDAEGNPQQAALIVCNPPWLPSAPINIEEMPMYDTDGQMLQNFLKNVTAHLLPEGEVWLILSDLAERLKLRSREELLNSFAANALLVKGKIDLPARPPRTQSPSHPLYKLRSQEIISLWRLMPEGDPLKDAQTDNEFEYEWK